MTSSEILMAVFTAVIAVTGVIGAIIFGGQLTAMQAQLGEMQTASAEIRRQSNAAERSSTAGRAYLFVRYETPQAPMVSQTEPLWSVPINFIIKNYGQSPAIITSIETHLLKGKDGNPMHDPPNPTSEEATELFETMKGPGIDIKQGDSSWSFLNDVRMNNPIRIIVAAGDSGAIQQSFTFANRKKPLGPSPMGAWFYCAITYRDIFNQKDRHTYYYVKLTGATVSFPANSEYNRWD